MGLDPAVAAVRRGVRAAISDLDPGTPLVVACSGGADSLALLSATVFEAARAAHEVIGVTVDHGLQAGSGVHAERVTARIRGMGVAEAISVCVEVGRAGGPEAAARSARYDALRRVAAEAGASVVLLGHTRDDQAETVLLGLARGSGGRSLSGMAPVSGIYRRPLLEVSRVQTRAACRAEDLEVWDDPHNEDRAHTRVRVRLDVLPVLERELGPGVAEALARTARQLREDADALDALARVARDEATVGPVGNDGAGTAEDTALDVEQLLTQPAAVRRRVLRRSALDAGCPGTELFLVHVDAVDALVTRWRGQREVHLPGHVTARRVGGTILLSRRAVGG